MYPFKTRNFHIQTQLTSEKLHYKLITKVKRWEPISIKTDGELYGIIKANRAKIELGQSFQWNSFRPIIVFKWETKNSKTEIMGYYRVALSVLLTTLFIPLFGLYLSIKINNILPILVLSFIWTVIYFTFGLWLFNKDFKWIQEEFLKLVNQ